MPPTSTRYDKMYSPTRQTADDISRAQDPVMLLGVAALFVVTIVACIIAWDFKEQRDFAISQAQGYAHERDVARGKK